MDIDDSFYHADRDDDFGSSDDEVPTWNRNRHRAFSPSETVSTEPMPEEFQMKNFDTEIDEGHIEEFQIETLDTEIDETHIEELNNVVLRDDNEIGIALKSFHIESESSDNEDPEVIKKTYDTMTLMDNEELNIRDDFKDGYDSDDELCKEVPTVFENLERLFNTRRAELLVPDKNPHSKDKYWIRTPVYALREMIIAFNQTIITKKIIYLLPDAESNFYKKTYLVIMNVGAFEGRGQSSLEFLAENAAAADILEKMKEYQEQPIGAYGICPGSRIPREIMGDLKDLCCMYKLTMPAYELVISNRPVEETPQFKMICKVGEMKLEARSDLVSVAKKIVTKLMFEKLTSEPYPDTPVLIGDECLTSESLPVYLNYKEKSEHFIENLIQAEYHKATGTEENLPPKKAKLSPEVVKPIKYPPSTVKRAYENFDIALTNLPIQETSNQPENSNFTLNGNERPSYRKRTVTAPNPSKKKVYADCATPQIPIVPPHNLKSLPITNNLQTQPVNDTIKKARLPYTLPHENYNQNDPRNKGYDPRNRGNPSIPQLPPSISQHDPRLKNRIASNTNQITQNALNGINSLNGVQNNFVRSIGEAPTSVLKNAAERAMQNGSSLSGGDFPRVNLRKRMNTMSVMLKLGPNIREPQNIPDDGAQMEERRF